MNNNNIIEVTIWHPAKDVLLTDAVPFGPRVIHTPEREQRCLLNLSEVLYAENKNHVFCSLEKTEQKTTNYWEVHLKNGTTINCINLDKSIGCEKQA